MKDIIDFDAMFEEYAMEWFKEHEGEYATDDEIEAVMPDVYETWASSPSHKLGGIAPRAFFDSIEKPEELIGILVGTSEGESNPSSLLLDAIVENGGCAELLRSLLEKPTTSVKLKLICLHLLSESSAEHPLNTYLEWIQDESTDEDLREDAIEVLKENASKVKEKLFEIAAGASLEVKTIAAEILISAGRDDRTFELLTSLFAEGDNIPLYAQYLGMYGDERAAAQLYRALDTCNYAEYIEIKNAIERLGGVVDDTRDFTGDPTYELIKKKPQ